MPELAEPETSIATPAPTSMLVAAEPTWSVSMPISLCEPVVPTVTSSLVLTWTVPLVSAMATMPAKPVPPVLSATTVLLVVTRVFPPPIASAKTPSPAVLVIVVPAPVVTVTPPVPLLTALMPVSPDFTSAVEATRILPVEAA